MHLSCKLVTRHSHVLSQIHQIVWPAAHPGPVFLADRTQPEKIVFVQPADLMICERRCQSHVEVVSLWAPTDGRLVPHDGQNGDMIPVVAKLDHGDISFLSLLTSPISATVHIDMLLLLLFKHSRSPAHHKMQQPCKISLLFGDVSHSAFNNTMLLRLRSWNMNKPPSLCADGHVTGPNSPLPPCLTTSDTRASPTRSKVQSLRTCVLRMKLGDPQDSDMCRSKCC